MSVARILKLAALAAALFVAALQMRLWSGMARRHDEGYTRGALGSLRAGLSMYQQEHHANPADLAELAAGGKYLAVIPTAKLNGLHVDSSRIASGVSPTDAGGWLYDAGGGKIFINCTHTDSRGKAWIGY